MTRDPIALRVAQPAVDMLHIDPAPAAKRCADVYLMLAVLVAATNVVVLSMSWMGASEGIHVIAAWILRRLLYRWADTGPAIVAVPGHGAVHLAFRGLLITGLACEMANVSFIVSIGLASIAPIILFAACLHACELAAAILSIYIGMCRRPPPRRRTARLHTA